MSRFKEEVKLVPGVAWAIGGGVYVAVCLAMYFLPIRHDATINAWPLPFQVALALLPGIPMAAYLLLIGYINRDARRRGMRHVLWTLLAIFVPNAIGVILYFVMRDPLMVHCTGCGTQARSNFAYCPGCGEPLGRACPQCKQRVEGAWANCAYCGQKL